MPLFDPDTGRVVDRDALRSVQINAAGPRRPRVRVDRAADTKTVEVIDDDNGRTMAHSTFHGSGRVDANVFPRAAGVGLGTR